MYGLIRRFDRLPRWARASIPLGTVLALGYLQHRMGAEVSFSVLYLIPVALAAWSVSGRLGLSLALLSSLLWGLTTWDSGGSPTRPWIPIWNGAVRLLLFVLVASLVSALRRALQRERALARTDPLTGSPNRRALMERAGRELARARRTGHSVALAYLDVDDFKDVNDRFGHAEADRLLQRMAAELTASIRSSDMLARMGGDEFALLLPDLTREMAEATLARALSRLRSRVAARGLTLGFSAGGVVARGGALDLDTMLRAADQELYRVKAGGKGSARFVELDSASPLDASTVGG